ncbi:hypothetical protein BCV70DRAFT_123937 [Testicularia cyperi]|uniref:Uncharacterized protein n=1 Tax=Testicularia cyperi TaxID=1882483 RepID=A0A317XNW3_9BASI|nr:hypothetical protein BCV70DRAFT_123937 [Testicularia cyperi]
MSLKANFEQIPTLLLPPPSYQDSRKDGRIQLHQGSPASVVDGLHDGARFVVWRRVIRHYLTLVSGYEPDEEAARCLELLNEVRFVSRLVYNAVMNLMRARYTAAYLQHVRFPLYSTGLSSANIQIPRRETRVLDHFVVYEVNRRYLSSQDSLLLNNDDSETDHRQVEQDLFGWLQPQTFLEDQLGSGLPPTHAVQLEHLLVRFQFTRAAVTLPACTDPRVASRVSVFRKEFFAISRPRDEPIFVTADRLMRELKRLVFVRKHLGGQVYYELVGEVPG